MELRPFSDIAPREITWLWRGRLGLGKLAVLDGDPGLGKSFLLVDWCARLSRGCAWPDGTQPAALGNSIILNGEDCPEDTIRRRLEDAGADLSRVFFPKEDEDALRGVSFPSAIAALNRALTVTDARLLVIDPLMAFLDTSVAGYNDQSVRRALGPLARLARMHRCAVVMARHPNKSVGLRALYRGGGSIGISGMGRSGWFVGADPTDPKTCVLAQAKNNLAAAQPSLAYRMRPTPAGGATVEWLGPSLWTAEDLAAGPCPPRPRDKAKNFLLSALASGPRRAHDLADAAAQFGISDMTLQRAKKDAKVRSQRLRVDGKLVYYSLLPDHEIPLHLMPDEEDIEEYLRPVRDDYLAT